MFTTQNLLIFFLAIVLVVVCFFAVVSFMHLVKIVHREALEFFAQYRAERTKCHFDNDYLFTEWVQDFRTEPFNMMREYADA
jgi:hypothetical protein